MNLGTKRIYDPPAAEDGWRVLVDRMWPRGVSKEKARLNAWVRELAPSAELRRWYDHDPAKWPEFQRRYARELSDRKGALDALRQRARQGRVTLLFAAKSAEHCNAAALQRILQGKVP